MGSHYADERWEGDVDIVAAEEGLQHRLVRGGCRGNLAPSAFEIAVHGQALDVQARFVRLWAPSAGPPARLTGRPAPLLSGGHAAQTVASRTHWAAAATPHRLFTLS
jgi:hypothetical protein